MQFEYLYQTTATGTIDVEDEGNFVLRCFDGFYKEYILIVKTVMGTTKVIQYGPRFIDLEKACRTMNYTYQEFDFSVRKIEGIVEKFLNGPNLITQAQVVDLETVIPRMKGLVEFLNDTEG